MKAFTIVAIDGAAATGKTTIAKLIAEKYGLMYVSTGEHYRIITLKLLNSGVSYDDNQGIITLLNNMHIESYIIGNQCVMTVGGEVIKNTLLRSTEINESVSKFAQLACVRSFLFDFQRSQDKIARKHDFYGLVIEGRDTTSAIFKDADLRFFLHADIDKRKQRRNKDNEMDCISCRDYMDSKVTICESDVIRVDTGRYNLQEVMEIMSLYIEEL